MTIESKLIVRYEEILFLDMANPFYESKAAWRKDIEIKILELKRIISHRNK